VVLYDSDRRVLTEGNRCVGLVQKLRPRRDHFITRMEGASKKDGQVLSPSRCCELSVAGTFFSRPGQADCNTPIQARAAGLVVGANECAVCPCPRVCVSGLLGVDRRIGDGGKRGGLGGAGGRRMPDDQMGVGLMLIVQNTQTVLSQKTCEDNVRYGGI
jgi:hypothetical protein